MAATTTSNKGHADRYLFSMMNLIGRNVQVRKTNGCILAGVVCSAAVPSASPEATSDIEGEYKEGITLRYISHVGGPEPAKDLPRRERVKIPWEEIDFVMAKSSGGADGYAQTPEAVASLLAATSISGKKGKGLETDTRISTKVAGVQSKPSPNQPQRDQLQAVPQEWLAAPAPSTAPADAASGSFDQFKVNADKFGVRSTYQEDLYTTKLDMSKITAEQSAKAERLAREIEGSNSSNVHVSEERGHKVSGGLDEDEEAKYGAVLGSGGYKDSYTASTAESKTSNGGGDKYKPPQVRDKQQQGPPPLSLPRNSPPPRNPSPAAGSGTVATPAAVPSYASMVKGGDATAAVAATRLASKSGKYGKDGRPVAREKSREEIFRELKEFSQTFSPNTKAKPSRGMTPPDMNLESQQQSPSKQASASASGTEKPSEKPQEAQTTAASTTSENGAEQGKQQQQQLQPDAAQKQEGESTPKAAASAATTGGKKTLNPNARTFNPTGAAFFPSSAAAPVAVPVGGSVPPAGMQPPPGVIYSQPQQPGRGGLPPPRMIQFAAPPPPVVYPSAQQVFFPPPGAAYVMPVAYPGTGAFPPGGGRPIYMSYPPTGPQMYSQPMLIPAGAFVPPPPMPMAPPGAAVSRSPQMTQAQPLSSPPQQPQAGAATPQASPSASAPAQQSPANAAAAPAASAEQ